MPALFVTGTDTGIGKTLVSSLLLSSLGSRGNYFKPIQTGSDLDRVTVSQLTGFEVESMHESVYQFPEPEAPYTAARKNGVTIQLDQIEAKWNQNCDRYWVVEGAGGLLVPLNSCQTIRDLVRLLKIPILLVCSTRLGTINHTLLSIECARSFGIRIAGLILTHSGPQSRVDVAELSKVLEEFSDISVVAKIPFLENVTRETVQRVALEIFPFEKVRQWFE